MNNYNEKLVTNIKISYIYNFLMHFRATEAIWIIYLSSMGLSLIQIGLLESIYHLTSLIFEIPSGAVADILGKKFSIVIGRIFAVVSTILMIVSLNMFGFAASFIFNALSNNFDSGASESLTYESLKILNRQSDYKKISGIINILIEVGQGLAVVIGGLLSDKRFIYAYLFSLIFETICIFVSFTFTEPKYTSDIIYKEKPRFKALLKNCLNLIKVEKLVFYLIIYFSLISTIGTTVYFYCQKYFDMMFFTKTSIALMFAVGSIISALSSVLAYRIENKLHQDKVIILLPVLSMVTLVGLALSSSISVMFFFAISCFISGFSYPIFSDYINTLIPSEFRATLLSIESLFFSLFMILFFPIVGFIADKIGLSYAFICAAILFLPIILFIISKLNKVKSA